MKQLILAGLTVLVLAGCGGGGESAGQSTAGAATSTAGTAAASGCTASGLDAMTALSDFQLEMDEGRSPEKSRSTS